MSGKIKGQHMGRSNGNRGHMRWHTSTNIQLTPQTSHVSKSMLHTTSSHFISSHFISFHPTSGPTQGPQQQNLKARALAHIHRNAFKPHHKTNESCKQRLPNAQRTLTTKQRQQSQTRPRGHICKPMRNVEAIIQ